MTTTNPLETTIKHGPLERFIFMRSIVEGQLGELILKYWSDILDADLLKYRMPDLEYPHMGNVQTMIQSDRVWCFACFDQLEKRICADCMLTDFTGKAVQVHFSVHPDYIGKNSVMIGKTGVRYLFSLEKEGDPVFTTLIGIMPVVNRLAIRWTERVGYTYKTTLTNMLKCCYDTEEKIQDGAVYQITKGDI